jgi:hypothetical protein
VDYETLRRRADPDFAHYLDQLAQFDTATLANASREETLAFWLVRFTSSRGGSRVSSSAVCSRPSLDQLTPLSVRALGA